MTESVPPSPSLDATPLVNRENPWPGLCPFEEGDCEFFFGRETEVAELARLVKREKLTVPFAKSGLGKTFLLRAGLRCFSQLGYGSLPPVPTSYESW